MKWVSYPFSSRSSWTRNWIEVSCIADGFFTNWAINVVWHSHRFKNFPQFVVIHIVKGFSVVSETEVVVFLEFSCFLYDPMDVDNWSLVSLPFLNLACTSGRSQLMYCWSLAWRILSMTLLACEMSFSLYWSLLVDYRMVVHYFP